MHSCTWLSLCLPFSLHPVTKPSDTNQDQHRWVLRGVHATCDVLPNVDSVEHDDEDDEPQKMNKHDEKGSKSDKAAVTANRDRTSHR